MRVQKEWMIIKKDLPSGARRNNIFHLEMLIDNPSLLSYQFPEPAPVAQSVEQGTENPRVGGSIPSWGTNFSRVHTEHMGYRLYR